MLLLNYTTEIDANTIAVAISSMLSKAEATTMLTEYDKEEGSVRAISWRLLWHNQPGFLRR